MTRPSFRPILDFCERLLSEHGDTPDGVGWTARDAAVRYQVMLDLVRRRDGGVPSLLDFGCGAGHLLEYLRRNEDAPLEYHGLDVSAQAIELCRRKFPGVPFLCADVLSAESAEAGGWPRYDYVVMNGIFTYKGELGEDEMFEYCKSLLREVFAHARIGIAFNVMSKQVDWEREDLFHLPIDPLLTFLSRELSRHVVVRHDYGLYEYTTYVYRGVPPGGLAGARSRIGEERADDHGTR